MVHKQPVASMAFYTCAELNKKLLTPKNRGRGLILLNGIIIRTEEHILHIDDGTAVISVSVSSSIDCIRPVVLIGDLVDMFVRIQAAGAGTKRRADTDTGTALGTIEVEFVSLQKLRDPNAESLRMLENIAYTRDSINIGGVRGGGSGGVSGPNITAALKYTPQRHQQITSTPVSTRIEVLAPLPLTSEIVLQAVKAAATAHTIDSSGKARGTLSLLSAKLKAPSVVVLQILEELQMCGLVYCDNDQFFPL